MDFLLWSVPWFLFPVSLVPVCVLLDTPSQWLGAEPAQPPTLPAGGVEGGGVAGGRRARGRPVGLAARCSRVEAAATQRLVCSPIPVPLHPFRHPPPLSSPNCFGMPAATAAAGTGRARLLGAGKGSAAAVGCRGGCCVWRPRAAGGRPAAGSAGRLQDWRRRLPPHRASGSILRLGSTLSFWGARPRAYLYRPGGACNYPFVGLVAPAPACSLFLLGLRVRRVELFL